MLDICFLGTGAMMPLPTRRLASLILRRAGRLMLIDCGEGTQVAVREAGLSLARIDAIFITHFHADHIAGLPGLLLSAGSGGRVQPVTLYGPSGLRAVVDSLRVIAPELPFPLEFHELHGKTGSAVFEDARLTFFALRHMLPCYGVALDIMRPGKFDADAAKAKGIPVECWSVLQRGEAIAGFTPDMVLGPARRGIRFAYMTDTRPIADVSPFMGADVLVCEGTYGEPDKAEKAALHGHMTFHQAAELAARAEVQKLFLTHYSPAIADPNEYIESARAVFPQTDAAHDLMKLTLNFPE